MVTQNTTKMPPAEAQEQVTDYSPEQLAFFADCAEKSGMTLEQWMAFEPF